MTLRMTSPDCQHRLLSWFTATMRRLQEAQRAIQSAGTEPARSLADSQLTVARTRAKNSRMSWQTAVLGATFKEHFVAGLKRLHAKGQVAFDPPVLRRIDEPSVDAPDFGEWLDRMAGQAWNVFIEAPPEHSQPGHMTKYLARYLTGGPISDGRLISQVNGEVTFWARSKNKRTGNQPRPFALSGVEFVRRWSMHILPKGFTKTGAYGGFSCRHRQDYLQRCRQLLRINEDESQSRAANLAKHNGCLIEAFRKAFQSWHHVLRRGMAITDSPHAKT